jgi:hypothetical protein
LRAVVDLDPASVSHHELASVDRALHVVVFSMCDLSEMGLVVANATPRDCRA